MEIGVIPIPILVDSHSHSQSHVLSNSCPIPMGLPWDSHSHWDSQSHAHLKFQLYIYTTSAFYNWNFCTLWYCQCAVAGPSGDDKIPELLLMASVPCIYVLRLVADAHFSRKFYANCLQCFDTVGWACKGIRPVKHCLMTDEVLAWLSVWSEAQMICIWSSWRHCDPIIFCFKNPDWFNFSGAGLPRLSWTRDRETGVYFYAKYETN